MANLIFFFSKTVKIVLMNLVIFIVLLLMLEFALHAWRYVAARTVYANAEPYSPPAPLYLPDKILGHKPNAEYAGHDRRGWRNPGSLDKADIVVLGDSQTYGVNSDSESAWPQLLAHQSDKSVYQLAFGGYGPAHYLLLADAAIEFEPETVIVALYFGNDLVDSYLFAHNMKPDPYKWEAESPELVKLRTTNKVLIDKLIKAEEIDPGYLRTRYVDCQRRNLAYDQLLLQSEGVLEMPPLEDLAEQERLSWYFNYPVYFFDHRIGPKFEIYKKIKAVFPWETSLPMLSAPYCLKLNTGKVKTILGPSYRLMALISSDPRVAEGLRISIDALESIRRKLDGEGIQLLVALIPTKETVYREFAQRQFSKAELSELEMLWREEGIAKKRLVESFIENGIAYVDTTDALAASAARGEKPYDFDLDDPLEGADGHPNAQGYRVISKTIADELDRIE